MRADVDFAAHMEAVALALRGQPSSKHGNEWRYGTNGSLSIDIERGTFFNHETKEGGGTLAFIRSEKPGTDALDYLASLGCIKPRPIPYGAASDPFKATFKNNSKQFRIAKTWPYTDEAGAELFEVCRMENGDIGQGGKPVKKYYQRRKTPEGYINNVKDIRQVPYRLPELIEAIAQDKLIFITEGEKCADAVIGIGGAATTNAGGAKNWKDVLTPFFKGADVCILPDNDTTGAGHGRFIAEKLQGGAKRVRILELPGLPPKGDVADWIVVAGGTLVQLCELAAGAANAAIDGPLPLFPPLPDAEPYPIDAIGRTLSRAASAIARKVQVPLEMAAQAVLAATSLATCPHGDIMMPFGQTRPLSLFCVTIAPSGDRKTSADIEATWPLARREAVLREENIEALREWRIEHAAWSAEKRKIESGKSDFSQRKSDLAQLGDEPEKPLEPNLLSDSPTVEGLIKNWPGSHAALGMFSAEGSMFTAGHGMLAENQLKTAATLSTTWDGRPIKRIRAGDGVSVLPGRRLSLHLMIQPDAAGHFLSSPSLRDQGLLSRILVAHPQSMAGNRFYKDTDPGDAATIKAYGARLLSILEKPPALAAGKRNELDPPVLVMSAEAKSLWIAFHDHLERQSRGPLEHIRDFAAKAPEHAARIAGVITTCRIDESSIFFLSRPGACPGA